MIGYNGLNNKAGYNPPSQGIQGSSMPQGAGGYGAGQNRNGNNYSQNQILTASPGQILIMLCDAAIRCNREAQIANDAGDTSKKLEKIGRVFNIISELSNTLDYTAGGEIAEELDALYQFHMQELGRARTDSSNKHLKFVEEFLVEWRETWQEVIELNRVQSGKSRPGQGQGLAVSG